MKTEMLKKARRLWVVDGVPSNIARSNMRKWIRSVRLLGDRWIALSKQITQEEKAAARARFESVVRVGR